MCERGKISEEPGDNAPENKIRSAVKFKELLLVSFEIIERKMVALPVSYVYQFKSSNEGTNSDWGYDPSSASLTLHTYQISCWYNK